MPVSKHVSTEPKKPLQCRTFKNAMLPCGREGNHVFYFLLLSCSSRQRMWIHRWCLQSYKRIVSEVPLHPPTHSVAVLDGAVCTISAGNVALEYCSRGLGRKNLQRPFCSPLADTLAEIIGYSISWHISVCCGWPTADPFWLDANLAASAASVWLSWHYPVWCPWIWSWKGEMLEPLQKKKTSSKSLSPSICLCTPPFPPGCNLQLHFVLSPTRRPPSTQEAPRVKKEEDILFRRVHCHFLFGRLCTSFAIIL